MQPPVERIDVSTEELQALLEQARPSLSPEGYEKLRAAIRTLGYVTELLEKQGTTLAALRDLLCPASTGKTAKVLQQAGIETEKKPQNLSFERLCGARDYAKPARSSDAVAGVSVMWDFA
jgi:hypothetical protein